MLRHDRYNKVFNRGLECNRQLRPIKVVIFLVSQENGKFYILR
jgi:hypothetical protein